MLELKQGADNSSTMPAMCTTDSLTWNATLQQVQAGWRVWGIAVSGAVWRSALGGLT
jgi:hypothetical protein